MKLLNLFSKIWNFRRNRKKEQTFDEILDALDKAIQEKKKQQFLLQGDIMHKMKRYLKVGADSQFIPIGGKSEFEIRKYIERKWGKRMKRWDIYLTKDMRLDIK